MHVRRPQGRCARTRSGHRRRCRTGPARSTAGPEGSAGQDSRPADRDGDVDAVVRRHRARLGVGRDPLPDVRHERRPDPGERSGARSRLRPGLASRRPAEDQVLARARHRDVEEPRLLLRLRPQPLVAERTEGERRRAVWSRRASSAGSRRGRRGRRGRCRARPTATRARGRRRTRPGTRGPSRGGSSSAAPRRAPRPRPALRSRGPRWRADRSRPRRAARRGRRSRAGRGRAAPRARARAASACARSPSAARRPPSAAASGRSRCGRARGRAASRGRGARRCGAPAAASRAASRTRSRSAGVEPVEQRLVAGQRPPRVAPLAAGARGRRELDEAVAGEADERRGEQRHQRDAVARVGQHGQVGGQVAHLLLAPSSRDRRSRTSGSPSSTSARS